MALGLNDHILTQFYAFQLLLPLENVLGVIYNYIIALVACER